MNAKLQNKISLKLMSSAWQKRTCWPNIKANKYWWNCEVQLKINEFQWAKLLTQILSFISILAKQNQKQNLMQRKRESEFQGLQDWRKLWKWCTDDGTTVPFHCAMHDSSSPSLSSFVYPSWWKSTTMVSRTIWDNCWSQMEEIIYSWSTKWEIN